MDLKIKGYLQIWLHRITAVAALATLGLAVVSTPANADL